MKIFYTFFTALILINFSICAQAEHVMNIDKALKKTFKNYDHIQSERINFSQEQITHLETVAEIDFKTSHYPNITQHILYKNNEVIGYAYEDTVIGKWGPIHYSVLLDTKGKILQTSILDFYEIRGRPAMKRRFLKQYSDKGINDPIKLRQDIDGVSGATITSRSLTDGVRKIVHIYDLLVNNNPTAK